MTGHQPSTINHQLKADLQHIVTVALAEDIGTGDITSQLLIPQHVQAEMRFVAREDMVACGTFIPAAVYAQLDKSVGVSAGVREGEKVRAGMILAKTIGPARALLAGERVALNLMQRMCGVATLTRAYVEAVRGTKAIILDTRKTMPGLRALDKDAVRAGGGQNHRMGLYDMVLVKDNHIALSGEWRVASGEMPALSGLIEEIRKKLSLATRHSPLVPIIIECDTLSQVKEALAARPDRILLDNMDIETLHKAVALVAGRVPLEASGGVTLDTVRAIAETGVDYISVGKLTHSAPAVDIGADMAITKSQ